ncbi:MAG: GNAT family N-acetyltransferase [Deltaproteobacteria bacterium]|jgi:predicted GNAT family N-acyltransferase|nr:GNAT family N-acetyltransferase [Deltaproteobacteria bacterium]
MSRFKVKIVKWSQYSKVLSSIRREVFIIGQNCPINEELDGKDSGSDYTHFLVLNTEDEQDIPLGTARVSKEGKIERMAIKKNCRGQGAGRKLLAAILQHLDDNNYDQAILHSQTHAIPFYEKAGFIVKSELFYEAGIPHKTMIKKL